MPLVVGEIVPVRLRVRVAGLEPARLSTEAFKASASAISPHPLGAGGETRTLTPLGTGT